MTHEIPSRLSAYSALALVLGLLVVAGAYLAWSDDTAVGSRPPSAAAGPAPSAGTQQ